MSVKILLADDHEIVREGLRSLLEKQEGMEVIGEAEDGRKTIELVRELVPDIVIMDLSMPNLNGIDATRQLVKEFPGIKIVVLSMYGDKYLVEEMFLAGATAYLLKDRAFKELVEAIDNALDKRIYLGAEITGVVVKDLMDHLSLASDRSSESTLTLREREILQFIAEGKNTKEIAFVLNISVKTVETHRQHIMKKLDIDNVAGLTKYAIRHGLTSSDK
jgi:two-component system response regulator NreC